MSSQNIQTIELKRIVMVKAIVTENFKNNLIAEFKKAITTLTNEMEQLTNSASKLIREYIDKNNHINAKTIQDNLNFRLDEISLKIQDLQAKIIEAEDLQLNSEFVQGPLEGPVQVTIGDNLYKKVGAAEIVVMDGIIVDIRNADDDEYTNDIFKFN